MFTSDLGTPMVFKNNAAVVTVPPVHSSAPPRTVPLSTNSAPQHPSSLSTVPPSPSAASASPSNASLSPSTAPPSPLTEPAMFPVEEDDTVDLDAGFTSLADEMERVKQLNSVLSKLDEDGLIDKFQKIKSELHEIVQGKINSVLYDVASSGKSKEVPTVEKMHLPFSVGLGGFDEEQVEMVLQELKVEFPDLKQEHNILTKALLPEALKRIAKEVLN